jgi:hypothetical protein
MHDAIVEPPWNNLAEFAERASREPYFLAHALREHRERFGLTEAEQRQHLKVKPSEWHLFQLCRAPAAERWDEDLQALVERFNCDAEKLGRALLGGEVNGE